MATEASRRSGYHPSLIFFLKQYWLAGVNSCQYGMMFVTAVCGIIWMMLKYITYVNIPYHKSENKTLGNSFLVNRNSTVDLEL